MLGGLGLGLGLALSLGLRLGLVLGLCLLLGIGIGLGLGLGSLGVGLEIRGANMIRRCSSVSLNRCWSSMLWSKNHGSSDLKTVEVGVPYMYWSMIWLGGTGWNDRINSDLSLSEAWSQYVSWFRWEALQ